MSKIRSQLGRLLFEHGCRNILLKKEEYMCAAGLGPTNNALEPRFLELLVESLVIKTLIDIDVDCSEGTRGARTIRESAFCFPIP